MKANLVFKHFKKCCNKIIQSDLVDKAIFKHHSLKITEPLWAEDNIAGLFHYRLYRDLHTECLITIYPKDVLTMCNGWTKDEILLAVSNTACHEMAHFLHFNRCVMQMTAENAAAMLRKYNSQMQHGRIWKKIMREEMGTTPDIIWCKASSIPKILTTEI